MKPARSPDLDRILLDLYHARAIIFFLFFFFIYRLYIGEALRDAPLCKARRKLSTSPGGHPASLRNESRGFIFFSIFYVTASILIHRLTHRFDIYKCVRWNYLKLKPSLRSVFVTNRESPLRLVKLNLIYIF